MLASWKAMPTPNRVAGSVDKAALLRIAEVALNQHFHLMLASWVF
jgi:hypothetical protein